MTRIIHPCVGIEDADTSTVCTLDAQRTIVICSEMRLKKYRKGKNIVLNRLQRSKFHIVMMESYFNSKNTATQLAVAYIINWYKKIYRVNLVRA